MVERIIRGVLPAIAAQMTPSHVLHYLLRNFTGLFIFRSVWFGQNMLGSEGYRVGCSNGINVRNDLGQVSEPEPEPEYANTVLRLVLNGF